MLDERERIVNDFSKQLNERQGELLLSELMGKSLTKSVSAFVQNDGGENEDVTVELARHSPPITDPREVRVAVDPDDNSKDETTCIAYHKDKKGLIVSEEITAENYNANPPWPLLLVNSKEDDDAKELLNWGSDRLNKTMTTSYLSVTIVQLEKTKDWWGSDEYEIYERKPDYWGTAVLTSNGQKVPILLNVAYETDWEFNGGTHTDAAGRSRKFEDVNDNTTYWMDDPIRVGAARFFQFYRPTSD